MKTVIGFILLFLSTAGFSQLSSIELKALTFSNALTNGQTDTAYSYFSPETAAQLTPEQLGAIMGQLEGQLGKFERKEGVTTVDENGIMVTFQPMHFKNGLLDLKLTFDENEEIIGMFFVPHTVFELDLVQNEQFYEEEITVNTGKEIQLRGIITLPKSEDRVPAVVLVHGSGPNDMDETLGPNKVFKDLAHGLAEKGIAVIRYDKRTKAYAGRSELDINTLTLYEETIADAISAVDLARKDKRIDKKNVFVLGHSLGGMSAPRIGTLSKRVKGIIILAGNARPLEDLVLEQYEYLFSEDGTINPEEQKMIDDYKTQLNVLNEMRKTGTSNSGPLPLGLPANYWKYLIEYNQVETARDLEKPILVIQGGRDYQVTMKDYETWKKELSNKPNVSFKLYEKLNHQMREGEGLSYPSEYEIKSDLPLYLINDIATWILASK